MITAIGRRLTTAVLLVVGLLAALTLHAAPARATVQIPAPPDGYLRKDWACWVLDQLQYINARKAGYFELGKDIYIIPYEANNCAETARKNGLNAGGFALYQKQPAWLPNRVRPSTCDVTAFTYPAQPARSHQVTASGAGQITWSQKVTFTATVQLTAGATVQAVQAAYQGTNAWSVEEQISVQESNLQPGRAYELNIYPRMLRCWFNVFRPMFGSNNDEYIGTGEVWFPSGYTYQSRPL